MKNIKILGLAIGLLGILGISVVRAEDRPDASDGAIVTTLHAEGTVSNLTGDLLELKTAAGTLHFNPRDAVAFPKAIKRGDLISVWYTRETGKLKLQRASLPGKAGRKAGTAEPTRPKQFIDDRIFYSAQNGG